MQIEETIVNKSFSRTAADPYGASLELMRRVSELGKVIEKENRYATDGPYHRSDVVFDVVQHLDAHSKVKVSFYVMGENGTRHLLKLDMIGSFISRVEERGMFSQMFAEFYLEHVFPIMRRTAEGRLRDLVAASEAELERIPCV